MKDEAKTKEQLINELVETRQRARKLEALEKERKQIKYALQEVSGANHWRANI